MNLKKHIFNHNKVVIGGNLSAVVYAFIKDLPIIINDYQPPFPWEHWNTYYFNYFGFPFYKERTLKTVDGTKTLGDYKARIFEHLCFILSLGGKVIAHKNIEGIRIEDNKILSISFDNNKVIKTTFNELVIFNPNKVSGIKEEKEVKNLIVADWFNVRQGAQHELDLIETEDSFIKEIYFFLSPRVDPKVYGLKDLVSVSYLNEEEIKSIEYSELYAKLLIERRMKESGIKGYRRGFQRDGIRPRFSALLVEHSRRETRVINNTKSRTEDNITFDSRTEEEIIEQEDVIGSYLLCLLNRLNSPEREIVVRKPRKKKNEEK